ncbi:MAG: hypothetical protein IJ899_00805 [Blautia sp.]|nr:hypothetical protein [Blautia sp.]
MENKIYGYVRVSSTDQNEDRQLLALNKVNVPSKNIYQNRALGKGAGYERWAKGFNLKQTAKTLLFLQQHDIHNYEELERLTNEAVAGSDRLLASIKEKDARIKEIEALRQLIFDYSKTRKIYLEYKPPAESKEDGIL